MVVVVVVAVVWVGCGGCLQDRETVGLDGQRGKVKQIDVVMMVMMMPLPQCETRQDRLLTVRNKNRIETETETEKKRKKGKKRKEKNYDSAVSKASFYLSPHFSNHLFFSTNERLEIAVGFDASCPVKSVKPVCEKVDRQVLFCSVLSFVCIATTVQRR